MKRITKRLLSFCLSMTLVLSLCCTAAPVKVQAADYGLSNPRTDSEGATTWDCIYFGNYWQNDTNGDGKVDITDEKQPIKWRVLSVEGDDAFLLADQNLDCQKYHETGAAVTWETCNLRTWLNGDFYQNAFNSSEQSAIQTTNVVNENNPQYDTPGGNKTGDEVYLLSISEARNTAYGFAESYDVESKPAEARHTKYAEDCGAYTESNGYGWWWLRSPGYKGGAAARVHGNGGVTRYGLPCTDSGGVRPALHLDLSSSVWSKAGKVHSSMVTPYIALPPTAAPITYGDTLDKSGLSGGTVQYSDSDNTVIEGSFAWQDNTIKPAAADSNQTEYTIVFTPSDTENYKSVETKVTLTVKKAQDAPNMPDSTMSVESSMKKVGDVSLPEGWEWQASDTDKALVERVAVSAVAVYTGEDKGNYVNEAVTVAITRSCDHVAGEIRYTGEGENEPTCTESGLGHKECTKCGFVVESGIVKEALGHDYSEEWTIDREATCTENGEKSRHCTREGCEAVSEQTAITALGHTEDGGTVTKEPTEMETGTKTYQCTVCGYVMRTEDIGKLPPSHTHSYQISVTPATTNANGSVTETCSKCGDEKSRTVIYAVKTAELSQTSYTYNGKEQKPSVTVKDSSGKALKDETDYTVSYPAGMKNVGRYTVTVTLKGNYSGTVTGTFDIVPKGTSISKLTAKKKGFTIKWKKQSSQTTGYEIQYSTSRKFTKKAAKTVTVRKKGATSKSVSKLKAKKKYYVRIRTYKTVKINGESMKLYSAWSKVKKVKTKK